MAYSRILNISKKIKRFKLILEVEEVYQDVVRVLPLKKKAELSIISNAGAYIFSTELLKEKLNKQGKPDCIIYGTYKVEEKLSERFDDGKIHVVYAGTFDPRKGGGVAAETAKHLPDNYVVHICGFGNHKQIEDLQELAEQINKDPTTAHISYEGLLKGKDYLRFIQSCHIGLSPQNPMASFNGTSFPSKIMSYLSNGLSVVSVRIEAIERSALGKSIYFYNNQSPEDIAKTIQQIPANSNCITLIKELDAEFRRGLANTIKLLSLDQTLKT